MTTKDPPDLDKEMRKLPPITLRLHNEVKRRAMGEGISLQALVVKALEGYLKRGE